MSEKSKVQNKNAAFKTASLNGVLKKNVEIKEDVSKVAVDLTLVNDVLKQDPTSVTAVQMALVLNEEAETKVAKAADDLKRVNVKLAHEIAARQGIESELDEMKTDLAAVRDDLLQAQITGREAQQLALTDALTGLPNRVCFDQAIQHGLVQAKRQGWQLAVLFIDIDKFKTINDSYGHDVGDQVLLTVANRLKSFIRGGDMVSRWGGDEFVCLLLDIKQEADVLKLAGQLVQLVAQAFVFSDQTFRINISIGVAISSQGGDTAELLLKNADSAMYKAKAALQQVMLF